MMTKSMFESDNEIWKRIDIVSLQGLLCVLLRCTCLCSSRTLGPRGLCVIITIVNL